MVDCAIKTKKCLQRENSAEKDGSEPSAGPGDVDENELLRPLESGTSDVVYPAHDTLLDRAVAIKFLSVPQAQRTRFLTDALALARLHNPSMCHLPHWVAAGQPYLTSEYVRGQSLSALREPLPGGSGAGSRAGHRPVPGTTRPLPGGVLRTGISNLLTRLLPMTGKSSCSISAWPSLLRMGYLPLRHRVNRLAALPVECDPNLPG